MLMLLTHSDPQLVSGPTPVQHLGMLLLAHNLSVLAQMLLVLAHMLLLAQVMLLLAQVVLLVLLLLSSIFGPH